MPPDPVSLADGVVPWPAALQYALVTLGVLVALGYAALRRAGRDPLGQEPAAPLPDTTAALYISVLVYFPALLGLVLLRLHRPLDAIDQVLLGSLLHAGFGFVLLRFARPRARGTSAPEPRLAAGGIAGGLATFGLAGLVVIALEFVYAYHDVRPPEQGVVDVVRRAGGWDAVGLAATTLVLAPFAEEVFYRGIVYPALTRYLPQHVALVAQGAVFGIVHVWTGPSTLWPMAVPLGVVGWCAGAIYQRTGSLPAAFLLHATFNALNMTGIVTQDAS